jgi:hypothetical protein
MRRRYDRFHSEKFLLDFCLSLRLSLRLNLTSES